jgi:hypothetical protein
MNFAVWALALVHGVAAGTDTGSAWAIAFYVVAAASVTCVTVWRVLRLRAAGAWAVRAWPAVAGVVAAELTVALGLRATA